MLVQVGDDGDSGPEGGRRGRIVNILWSTAFGVGLRGVADESKVLGPSSWEDRVSVLQAEEGGRRVRLGGGGVRAETASSPSEGPGWGPKAGPGRCSTSPSVFSVAGAAPRGAGPGGRARAPPAPG